MSYTAKGQVIAVLPPVTGVGQKGPWGRCTVVVETQDGNYKKTIALENTSKYEDFSKLRIGQEIEAKFDVTSRQYQGKWYTSVNCFAWTVTSTPSASEDNDEAF